MAEPMAVERAAATELPGVKLNWFARLAQVDRGITILALVFLLTIPLLTPRVAASDEIEYFSYLHSLVFDHDLNFRDEYEHFCNLDVNDCIQSRFQETFLQDQTPTGLQINFGPIGSALLWLPFYLAAHLVTLALHALVPTVAADGYSEPYTYAIAFASLLYGWIGIALAYRIARDYTEEKIAVGAALVTLFATNAMYYMYVAPAMSHAPSLFASALFVFVWYRTRASRALGNWRSWAVLGACGALMTMVREQEAIFILIPLVESVMTYGSTGVRRYGSVDTGEKNRTADTHTPTHPHPHTHTPTLFIPGLTTMLVTWFILFTSQLIVYKILNGNFLPAKDVTQKFTWDGAHIGDVLFSNLHGLFSWTPLTLFAVLGFFFLWRKDRVLAAAFIITFAAEVYLLGSFSTWFGGAAFGMRRFVNCTVLFVVGLAALVEALRARVSLRALAVAGALLVVWNLFFIVQFATGMIPRDQPIDFSTMAYNQVVTVPSQLADIAKRFIINRGSFYKQK